MRVQIFSWGVGGGGDDSASDKVCVYTEKYGQDEDTEAAIDDWDKRFWAPAENKCFRCMPPALAAILRERHRQAMGVTGYTGTTKCVVCSNWRSHGLNDDRTNGQVAPRVRTGLEGT
jgi:hypothetical protein